MISLVTAEQMRAVEREFEARGGDLNWLMLQAGLQVAARISGGKRVLVLAGPGNNGGDALVAASTLRQRGDDVFVYTYKRESTEGLPGTRSEEDTALTTLRYHLERCSLVVDGLLGTGRRRPVADLLKDIIEAVNGTDGLHRIAIDVPTGVDADSGAVESVAFRADVTTSLGFGKRGLWGSPGRDYAGAIEIADIGIPPDLRPEARCVLNQARDISALLPRRSHDWNKGKSGSVLVLCGSADYCGAPVLVSTAAYRAGAGLVRVVVPEQAFPSVAAHGVEEVFTHVRASGWHTLESIDTVRPLLSKVDVVAVGPGLGGHDETIQFVRQLLQVLREADVPMVLDADGLNAVARWDQWWTHVPKRTVVTPHPGEMARLMGSDVGHVQSDRFQAAREAARTWGVTVVLKGSNTVIAEPSGKLRVNSTGGPNLGTAGTGDVLTGTIAAFIAQGLTPENAAQVGVWLHGSAGDELQELFGDAGTIASDLWKQIPISRARLDRGEQIA